MTVTCLAGWCGDGSVQAGEGCDDGDRDSGDGCSATCQPEQCGDGVLQAGLGEACDDANAKSGDGCSATCALEPCAAHRVRVVYGTWPYTQGWELKRASGEVVASAPLGGSLSGSEVRPRC